MMLIKLAVFANPAKSEIPNPIVNDNTLEITVTGIDNNNGLILLSLFNSAEGFPGDREKAVKSLKQKVNADKVSFIIKELPPGIYAVSLIHDENNNEKLDTNFVGIPKEGYGASNNVKKMFRGPRFEEASFEVDKNLNKIEVELIYL